MSSKSAPPGLLSVNLLLPTTDASAASFSSDSTRSQVPTERTFGGTDEPRRDPFEDASPLNANFSPPGPTRRASQL